MARRAPPKRPATATRRRPTSRSSSRCPARRTPCARSSHGRRRFWASAESPSPAMLGGIRFCSRRIRMPPKPRIAHLAGSNATIQNSPPLVTSGKAREKYGLPPLTDADGRPHRFDALRAQRLAAPVTVYVEQFSAHPLERDAAELYGPPDGYVDATGAFHKERRGAEDRPVYEITLRPEDGVYPLPYMARQVDGRPWEDDGTDPMAPESRARQPF